MKTLTLQQADRHRTDNREFLFLGGTPHDEICTQAGYNPDQLKDGIIECEVLINQLRRMYSQEPGECEFFILENHHEFGIYHEAAIYFNCTDPDDIEEDEDETFIYAMNCENLPDKWDTEALKELREKGHTQYQPAKVVKMKAA